MTKGGGGGWVGEWGVLINITQLPLSSHYNTASKPVDKRNATPHRDVAPAFWTNKHSSGVLSTLWRPLPSPPPPPPTQWSNLSLKKGIPVFALLYLQCVSSPTEHGPELTVINRGQLFTSGLWFTAEQGELSHCVSVGLKEWRIQQ